MLRKFRLIVAFLALMLPCAATVEPNVDTSHSESLGTPLFTPEEKDAQYRLLGLMMGGVVVSAGVGLVARRLLHDQQEGKA